MSARVSIAVGVYNGECYLVELLDSIRAQTFTDWECVLVDDGSTDGSAQILHDFAARDSRFRVLSQTNAGVGAARNAAMRASAAPFLMFADQDDRLAPTAVARALEAIESAQADVVRFHSNRVAKGSVFVWEHIYRRAALSDVAFPPITGGEDTAFFWELGFRDLVRVEIPDVLYWQRPHRGSFSRAVSPRYIANVFTGFRVMARTGRRYGLTSWGLVRRLFPHVAWFVLSVLARHFSWANVCALCREGFRREDAHG